MNENRIKKSMTNSATPMNFVQRTKKQMRKMINAPDMKANKNTRHSIGHNE